MLRVVLVHTSSRFSLDFVVLNLVPRPPFDEEIRVRDFVMLACSLSAIFSVMYTCCCVQLSFLCVSRKCEPALVWLAGFSVRECFTFFLHTKDSVDKRESLLVWLHHDHHVEQLFMFELFSISVPPCEMGKWRIQR